MANALQGRTFGLPNVVLIGAAALGIWFFFLRGKGASAGRAGTSPAGQATTDYSLGYAQGLQSAAPASAAQPAPVNRWTATTRGPISGQPQFTNIPVVGTPQGSPQVGSLPPSTQVNLTDAAPVNGTWPGQGPASYYQVALPGGASGYVLAQDLTGIAAGGVGGPQRKHHIGSRSSNLWHDSHPLIGARVHLPHYVLKVGGAGGSMRHHQAEVHRVARQSGVHPARLMMLNPRASSAFIRVA